MTSDKNDTVWDPFAGLFTTAIASFELERNCYCAELSSNIYNYGLTRVEQRLENGLQCTL